MIDSSSVFYDKTQGNLSSVCVVRKHKDNISLNESFNDVRDVGASCGSVLLKANEINSEIEWFNYLYIPYTGSSAEENRNSGILYLIPTFGTPYALYVISFKADGIRKKVKINLTSF